MNRFSQALAPIEELLAQGVWEPALARIANIVMEAFADPSARCVLHGSPALDEACARAGAMALAQWRASATPASPPAREAQPTREVIVYIATELYAQVGGHSLVLRDLIHARPDARHVVLVTNLHDRTLAWPDLAQGLPIDIRVGTAPAAGLGLKTLWLLKTLDELRPDRLILLAHHHDAAAVAAVQPGLAGEAHFFHHTDHDLALGVFHPHAQHVDCSPITHALCSHKGVAAPRYWPLVATDLGARAGHDFEPRGGGFTTCSHGSHVKFLTPGMHDYFGWAVERLRRFGGRHVHVGALPPARVAAWRDALAQAGIEASRLQLVDPVPSLWRWLRDSDVDLVVSSFPLQGFKGLVETMGAGMPVLIHDSSISRHHSSPDCVYPTALRWRSMDQMWSALASLSPALLRAHADASRAHYETWHHPRELAWALAHPGRHAPMPTLRAQALDSLALHWRGEPLPAAT